MNSFGWLTSALLVVLLSASLSAQISEEAKRIQADVLGVDSHNDTMQRVLIEGVDLGKRLPDGMVDLPRLREGGMHVPFFCALGADVLPRGRGREADVGLAGRHARCP